MTDLPLDDEDLFSDGDFITIDDIQKQETQPIVLENNNESDIVVEVCDTSDVSTDKQAEIEEKQEKPQQIVQEKTIQFHALSQAIKEARKIVIKIGSNTLAKEDGTINFSFMQNLARQCADLMDAGKQIVLVSSGAQVSGVSAIHGWARRRDVHYKQALCAIGQVELMDKWRNAFSEYSIHIGQLLLTKDDFENDHRTLNMRNTLFTLVDEGVIPIINENDSIAFDEIRIGDNDNLSALTAILWSADLLILFSDIDGVYTDNPKTNKDAKLVTTVTDIAQLRKQIKIGETNAFGTGGIETKLQAAEKTTSYGIPMILANGGRENELENLTKGNAAGTLFMADENCLLRELEAKK